MIKIYIKSFYNCYYEKNVFPIKWKQVTLQFFSNIFTGNSISDAQKKNYITKTKNSILYISTKDIDINGNINYSNALHIPEEKFNSFKMTNKNSILMCLEGANAGNKLGIIDENCFFVNKLCSISTFIVNYKYIYYFLRSRLFREQFFSNLQGIIGGVQLKKFKTLSIPLPPIQEQERIVAKIEELFTIVDKIENSQNELDELKKLAKNKILDLAIKGKLVPQDPNDEPASVLLERIKEEKERLIKEGKIKRDKNESYIYQGDDKNYYEKLPFGWTKCYLAQLIYLTSGTDLESNKYSEENIGIPYLTGASNIINSKIIINRYTYSEYINSHKNDILLTCKGTIGKIAVNDIGVVHIARQFMSITPFVDQKFLIIYLKSIIFELKRNSKSMIPGIDREQVLSKIVSLPPLNEQIKIGKYVELLLKEIG